MLVAMPDRVRTDAVPRAAVAVILAREPDPGEPVLGRPLAGRSLLDRGIDAALAHAERVVVIGDVLTDRCWTRPLDRGGDLRPPLAEALAGVAPDAVVLVHDLAWATVRDDLWERVLASAGERPVVPAVAVTDTVRDRRGALVERSELRQCQSPRAHRRRSLESVVASGGGDDLAALARHDVEVVLVDGDEGARPLMHPRGLALASARIAA